MNQPIALRVLAATASVFFIDPGLWAFFDAPGFCEELALFEPYNEDFIHDIGTFQVIDHDLGGKDSDISVFGLVTLLLAAGAVARLRPGATTG